MLKCKARAALKPQEKGYPKADGHGVGIVIELKGRQVWRYRY